jgi:hypothetical protein
LALVKFQRSFSVSVGKWNGKANSQKLSHIIGENLQRSTSSFQEALLRSNTPLNWVEISLNHRGDKYGFKSKWQAKAD